MDYDQVLAELESRGTEQFRNKHKRHGAGENQFGVSFAEIKNLAKLNKKNKNNHEIALKLWGTGNADARIYAALTADPKKLDTELLQRWVKDISYYVLADYFSGMVAKSSYWKELMHDWIESDEEYIKQCGYDVLASKLNQERKLSKEKKSIDVGEMEEILGRIEAEIQTSPNRAKHTMNGVIIAIGGYISDLSEKALEVAQNIGKVEVDHGETGCVTPDAVPYIKKMLARQKK